MYRHFLHGRTDSNVRPVPEQCRETVSLDCAGNDQEWWPGFLTSLEPSPSPKYATPACDIDALLATRGIGAKAARLFLQGKGFSRIRSKRGLMHCWFYQYRFADEAGAKGVTSFVKLRG